jgi:hypothetical protein
MSIQIGPQYSTNRDSVIFVNTSFPEYSTAVVYVSSVTTPGFSFTVQDFNGGLSRNKYITISTIKDIKLLSPASTIAFNSPFDSYSFTNISPTSWIVNNKYNNPLNGSNLLLDLQASTIQTSNLSCLTISTVFSSISSFTSTIAYSSFIIPYVNNQSYPRPSNRYNVAALSFQPGQYQSFGTTELHEGQSTVTTSLLRPSSIILLQRVSTNNSQDLGYLFTSNTGANTFKILSYYSKGAQLTRDYSSVSWILFNGFQTSDSNASGGGPGPGPGPAPGPAP